MNFPTISSLFAKHSEWTDLYGRHSLPRLQGIMGFLVFSSPRQSPMEMARFHSSKGGLWACETEHPHPKLVCTKNAGQITFLISGNDVSLNAVFVLDTRCLSLIPCACPRCVVPVLKSPCLSSIRCACPQYVVPVPDRLCLPSIRSACPQCVVPVFDTLCLSPILCACPQCVVPILDTLCLSSVRSACHRDAVPILNTLCLS